MSPIPRALPTETKGESGTSQSKSGTSVKRNAMAGGQRGVRGGERRNHRHQLWGTPPLPPVFQMKLFQPFFFLDVHRGGVRVARILDFNSGVPPRLHPFSERNHFNPSYFFWMCTEEGFVWRESLTSTLESPPASTLLPNKTISTPLNVSGCYRLWGAPSLPPV